MKKLLFLLWVLALPACGYHLRGAYEIPPDLKNAYLEGASLNLRENFLKTIHPNEGHFADAPEQSRLIIRIFNEDSSSRVLSLNERGRSNELMLYYRLNYELARPDNTPLLDRQALEIKREYFYNQQDIIAKENEQTVIRNEMYQQAARNIVNRARVVLAADQQ